MRDRRISYQIPFDARGNQLHDADVHAPGGKMVDNFEFEDELTYSTYRRARSRSTLIFTRRDGREVVMFISEFDELAQRMVGGRISGVWTFVKCGSNFGVRFVRPIAGTQPAASEVRA